MSSCRAGDSTLCAWIQTLWSVTPVILLITGSLGNLLNMTILLRRRMRALSTSVYLLCLSAGDLTFLWTSMFPRFLLQGYSVDIQVSSVFLCKILTMLTGVSSSYSVWILVLMTVERVLVTKWPFLSRTKLTRENTVRAVLITLLCCVLFNSHLIFSADITSFKEDDKFSENLTSGHLHCSYTGNVLISFYQRIWPLLVLLVLNVVPMTVILLGNINILISILAHKRNLVIPLSDNKEQTTAPRKAKSATKMLLLVSGMFVLTTLPFTIGHVILSIRKTQNANDEIKNEFIYTILRHVLYCNFTFNFVLYFISGSLFKQEWSSIMRNIQRVFAKNVVHQIRATEYRNGHSGTGSSNPFHGTQDTLNTF